MPRGGSSKGNPRGNAKKRRVDPEIAEDAAAPERPFCGAIKAPQEPARGLDLNNFGKSPLAD